MRRKLYFFLDRMKISRSERVAVSSLALLLLILSALNLTLEKRPSWSPEEFAALEKTFHEKLRQKQAETDAILARYARVNSTAQSDTVGVKTGAGQRNIVPDDTAEVRRDTTAGESSTTRELLVNINEASAVELQRLPGIGPAYSQRIVRWREINGAFTSEEQLLEVRGIGPVRLQNIRPLIEL